MSRLEFPVKVFSRSMMPSILFGGACLKFNTIFSGHHCDGILHAQVFCTVTRFSALFSLFQGILGKSHSFQEVE